MYHEGGLTLKCKYSTFEKIYDEAVARRNKNFINNEFGTITAAFSSIHRTFNNENWQDPLLSIFRNELYDAILEGTLPTKLSGTTLSEDKQQTIIIGNNHINYVLSWYGNRGRTEHFYRINNPKYTVTLLDVYTFFMDCQFDIITRLQSID